MHSRGRGTPAARGRAVGVAAHGWQGSWESPCSPLVNTTNADGSRGKERSRGHRREARMSRGWVSIHDPDDPGMAGTKA